MASLRAALARPCSRPHRAGCLLAGVIAAMVLSAAPARADTIFFLHAGNIWGAAPDGSSLRQVTTDGSYDFVSSGKTGTTPVLAFHRTVGGQSQFGTVRPDGSGETLNPYNDQMSSLLAFTRLDAAGDRQTWSEKAPSAATTYYADSVGVDGSMPAEIYATASPMDAHAVTFGDPQGSQLLFTDTAGNYLFPDNGTPCAGTDDYTDVLVRQVPSPRGTTSGPSLSAIYCLNNTIFDTPALSPDGSTIAAVASSTAIGSSGQIVTIPISAAVPDSASQSSGITAITPANSGDALPDFSPDGTRIAFQRAGAIYVVSRAGGPPLRVPLPSDASVPAWSPYTATNAIGGSNSPSGGGTAGGKVRVTVTLPHGQAPLRRGTILARVSCSAACYVAAIARFRVPSGKMIEIDSDVVHLLHAGRRLVELKLSRGQLRALDGAVRHRRVVINVTGALSDSAADNLGETKPRQLVLGG